MCILVNTVSVHHAMRYKLKLPLKSCEPSFLQGEERAKRLREERISAGHGQTEADIKTNRQAFVMHKLSNTFHRLYGVGT